MGATGSLGTRSWVHARLVLGLSDGALVGVGVTRVTASPADPAGSRGPRRGGTAPSIVQKYLSSLFFLGS